MTEQGNSNFIFSKSAIYQIIVDGELSEEWSEQLSGMDIKLDHSDTERPKTKLVGKLSDQAALSGVLNALYDLHLSIISVHKI